MPHGPEMRACNGLMPKTGGTRAPKATSRRSASSIRQRERHFCYSRRTTPSRGGRNEALADRISIAGGCDLLRGTARLPTSGRLRLRQRRHSEQRQVGVLLVAAGLYLQPADLWRLWWSGWLGTVCLVARLSQGGSAISNRHAPANTHRRSAHRAGGHTRLRRNL